MSNDKQYRANSTTGIGTDRRSFLKVAGASSLALLAGCSGDGDSDGGDGGSDGGDGGSDGGDGSGASTGDGGSNTEQYTLTYTSILPENHRLWKEGSAVWREKVTEKTGGQVQWETHSGGELGGSGETLTLLQNGVADAGLISATINSDTIPLGQVAFLPGVSDNQKKASKIWVRDLCQDRLFDADLKDAGIYTPAGVTTAPYYIGTQEKYTSLDDFEGKQFKSQGGLESMTIKALGATPVELAVSENYTALQRGTVDAEIGTILALRDFKYHEVIKYMTTNTSLGFPAIQFSVSLDTWNSLPDNVQTAMNEAGLETSDSFSEYVESQAKKVKQQYSESGSMEFYEFPNWEPVRQQLIDEVHPKWVNDLPDSKQDKGEELREFWVSQF